jgi:DNA-binding MarR family transcriptional regulator
MSTTTSTPDNPTTDNDDHPARPDGDDRPATDRAATAADHLWAALHARPGGTAEELSADAGIGRSTATKILARWVAEGTAARVPTAGKRSASRYVIPTPGDGALADPTDATASATVALHGAQQIPSDTTTTDTVETSGSPDTEAEPGLNGSQLDTTPGIELDDGPAAETNPPDIASDAVVEAAAPPDAVDSEPVPATTCEPDVAADAPLDVTGGTNDKSGGTEPTQAVATGRSARLAPGALHGMVEDYLREHPDEEHGPTKIGHDLGRSTGAVSNALERLVNSGYAVRTKDRPKRYSLATTETRGNDPEPLEDRDA